MTEVASPDKVALDHAIVDRRFRRGMSWNLVAAASNQGSTFLVNVILANLLGRHSFGQYAMVLSTIQVGALVAGLAMGYTAMKYLAEFRTTDPDRAGRVLGFCDALSAGTAILAGLALFFGAPALASRALHAPELTPLLKIAAGACLCLTVNGFLIGGLSGLERYRTLGKAGVAAGLAYVGICVGFARARGLEGAVAGLFAAALVQLILLRYLLAREAARQGIKTTYRASGTERGMLLHFALPAALGGLTTMPALWVGQAILARRPGGYEQLAVYVAAYNLATIALFLPSVANSVGMSLLNSVRGTGDTKAYRRVFWTNLRVTTGVVIAGAVVMGATGRYLLRAYGPTFLSGAPVLIVLLAGIVAEALTMALYQVVQSRERMWHGVRAIVLPRDLAVPLLALALVPSHGAAGLAWAYLLARAIGLCTTGLTVYRIGLS